jgi:hypothetical protein
LANLTALPFSDQPGLSPVGHLGQGQGIEAGRDVKMNKAQSQAAISSQDGGPINEHNGACHDLPVPPEGNAVSR